MSDDLLTVDGLEAGYGRGAGFVPVISDINLSIRKGEALGLVGESGSGKSTIASAVLDLFPAGLSLSKGRISYRGQDLSRLDPVARRAMLGVEIGAVFQDPMTSLNPAYRVGDQIAEPLIVHRGMTRDAARRRAVELLADVEIVDPVTVARSYPHQLSGGMRQRALIAAALACDPQLLVLDEPTTALDAQVEAQLMVLFNKLRAERGLSYLFISHNLELIARTCDRVAVLYAGQMVETGASAALLARPEHPYSRALLDAVPTLATAGDHRLQPIPGGKPDLANLPDGCRFAPRCAFAKAECRAPQVLRSLGETEIRCIRAEGLDLRPATGRPPVPRMPVTDQVVLAGRDLCKSYAQGSLLSNLRIGPRGITRLRPRFEAVKNVSLDIRKGEILGLVGQSGSGKSTVGRMLMGLDRPTTGDVLFEDRPVAGLGTEALGSYRRRVQMIFQNPDSSLNPRMTLREIVARPLHLFSVVPPTGIRDEVDRLLDQVQLPRNYAGRYPHQLSGGEKQRVGIARALASRPDVLLCDEPVSALDVSVQAAIVSLIEDLRAETGLSLLFISHDMAVVSHLCDRVAVMFRGEIVEIGETRQVIHQPRHVYTRGLIDAARGGAGAPQDDRALRVVR